MGEFCLPSVNAVLTQGCCINLKETDSHSFVTYDAPLLPGLRPQQPAHRPGQGCRILKATQHRTAALSVLLELCFMGAGAPAKWGAVFIALDALKMVARGPLHLVFRSQNHAHTFMQLGRHDVQNALFAIGGGTTCLLH